MDKRKDTFAPKLETIDGIFYQPTVFNAHGIYRIFI
jgi:hypothetical protein